MKKTLIYIVSFIVLGAISQGAKAQPVFKMLPKNKLIFPALKPLYIEGFIISSPMTIVKSKKIGSNKSFDFYQLPLDNMICSAPNNQVKGHIIIYNPLSTFGNPRYSMPNALPKVDIVK